MSDLQEPSPVDYKDEESGLGKEENPFDCAKEDSQHSSTDGNQLDGMTSHDVTQPRMNGFINGDHQLNGHVSEEEEFEIDIDPRMDMMMLEPQVDIIEDPDDMPTPYIPNPQQQPARQQSIFRRKRVIAAKPAKAVQRRQPIESPGSKRRLVADDAEISDDRSGCRSLVCDSSGIIIAEMVFRCMICAHVSDAISTAHRHYQSAHMSRQSSSQTSSATNRGVNRSIPQSLDAEDDLDFENDIQSEPSRGRSHQGGKANQSVQQNVPSNSHPYLDSSFSDSLSVEDEGSDGNAGSEPSILKKPGKFVTAPTPSCYVPGRNSKTNREFADCFRFSVSNLGHTTESILGANSSQSSSSTARGGYVTCAVCNITKFYASVQRRYGQFTCMGCAKFFGRFLLKPKRYFCPNLGTCSLETSPRCKACLLAACINTYVIDEKRMKIVNANRPIKKNASSTPSRILPAHTSVDTFQTQPLPHRQVTNPTNHGSINQDESMAFAPPPLVKAPLMGTIKAEKNGDSNYTSLLSVAKSSISESSGQRVATPRSSPTVSNRPQGSFGRKGTGCRQCANCLSDDCGKCNYCLDKPKFGGPNTLKKKCIQKKCLLVQTGGSARVRIASK